MITIILSTVRKSVLSSVSPSHFGPSVCSDSNSLRHGSSPITS